MSIDNFNPNDPRIQLMLAKEQLKFRDELNTLQSQLELRKQELSFLQEAIKLEKNKLTKKKGNKRTHAILVSLIFLISTLLMSYGFSSLTLPTPNPETAWFTIVLGCVVYIIGTVLTNIILLGETN